VFATFHDPAAAVNRLTGDHRDPVTHTPAYKRTAVHLERAALDALTLGDTASNAGPRPAATP
jgi:predicted molibdopterin-dependent oxidoreductase YjgC